MKAKHHLQSLIIKTFFCIAAPAAAASPQVISGSGTVQLDSNGTAAGVSFINQGTQETTLAVPSGTVNKDKNTVGISTDTNGLGNISFTASGSSTNINGDVGQSTLFMDNITQGNTSVTYKSDLYANSYTQTGGKTILQGTTVIGAGGINLANTLQVDKNVSVTATINGASGAIVQQQNSATINGNVNTAILQYLPQGTDLNQGSIINGNASASSITLGTGTVNINGDLILSGQSNIIRLTRNNGVVFPVYVSGTVTIDGEVTVVMDIPAFKAPILGSGYIVFAGEGGTNGALVQIDQNDPRFHSVGSNVNGNIFITSTKNSEAEAKPVRSTGVLFFNAIPIAHQNPGSDLDLIEGQLGFPTRKEYNNALYQIAPNIVLAGIGRETFNTNKNFLKIFLEHLRQDSSECECSCSNGINVWMDGFGSYGKQDNKNEFLGYRTNSWEGTIAFEKAFTPKFRSGFGFGYARTRVGLKKFDDTTHFNSYQGIIYLSYDNCHWFVDCGATFGWNHYKGKRNISFNTIHRHAHAKYHGHEYTGFAVTGYDFYFNNFQITPFGSLIYSNIQFDSYHEKGAKTLDLKIKKQHYDYVQSGLGLKGSHAFNTCIGCIMPELHLIWMHDFNTRSVNVKASFSDLAAKAGYFHSKGLKIDQNTWDIGGSLNFLSSCNFTLSFVYNYERSKHYYSHQGMLDFVYSF